MLEKWHKGRMVMVEVGGGSGWAGGLVSTAAGATAQLVRPSAQLSVTLSNQGAW